MNTLILMIALFCQIEAKSEPTGLVLYKQNCTCHYTEKISLPKKITENSKCLNKHLNTTFSPLPDSTKRWCIVNFLNKKK